MCETCGCGEPGNYQIIKPGQNEHDHHSHALTGNRPHGHEHVHEHEHEHGYGHEHSHDLAGAGVTASKRLISLGKDILESNNRIADRNRAFFYGRKVFCINMVSSPGSGKTTLLEKTIAALKDKYPVCVIEGDQQSTLDADRLAKLGIPVVQINTGSGCHLDARMVSSAVDSLDPATGSMLFIENVGNLVCPALFDLGESARILVMSVTEGEDKPLKYPAMFRSAHLCVINKTDLLPYVDFSIKVARENAGAMNHALEFLEVSARSGDGMETLVHWLIQKANTSAR